MKKLNELYKKAFGLYGKLLVSFLIILGIPIVISTCFYAYTMKLARDQSDRMGQNVLEMTRQDIDAQLANARNFENQWFLDTDVQEIARIKGSMPISYSQPLFQLYKDFLKQSSAAPLLRKAFIYFSGSDKVVSTDGNMSFDMYYQLYLENGRLSEEDTRSLLQGHHQYDTLLLSDKNGDPLPIMLLSLRDSSGQADAATVACLFDLSYLQKRLLSAGEGDDNVELMILTGDRQLIQAKHSALSREELDLGALAQAEERKSVSLGKNLWAISSASTETNWTYLMVTQSGLFAQNTGRIRGFFLIGLFLSICTGFGLSRYLAGRNYNPFRKLVDMIREQTHAAPGAGSDPDELRWLSSQVEHILQTNVNTQQLLDKSKKHMRNFCLWQLLTSGCSPEQLARYDIRFPYKNVLTVILLTDAADSESAADEETAGLKRFIIRNIFSELAQSRYHVECFEFGDRVAAIFNFLDQETSPEEDIRELIEQLRKMITVPFHFDIRGLIGSVQQNQDGIRVSYREALDLLEYLAPLDEAVISVTDIRGIEPNYDFPEDTEEMLVRAVSVGNIQTVRKCILDAFDSRFKGMVSVNMYRYLIYEMIGSLLKGASLGGLTDAASDVRFPTESSIRRSMKETKELLLEAAETICRRIEALREETMDNHNLSAEVEAFVDQHFTDPDLNISIASQHFNRSPSYLSGIYKKQTGRSLLEYINMKRITFAEGLLMDGVSVVDAAERSGFRDSGGFIRIYKRYRGITPGQLKHVKK